MDELLCLFHQSYFCVSLLFFFSYPVKPAHAVTSIQQSPVSNGHLFLVLS